MKIVAIIPAKNRNGYYEKGDLNNWGDVSLLEWKISQAKKIKNVSEVFISTENKEIKEIAKYNNVKVIHRKSSGNLKSLYKFSSLNVKCDYILWLNSTFPYLTEITINKFVTSFIKADKKKFDSALLYCQENEYFFKYKQPVNFNLHTMPIERKKIVPLKKICNGAIIFDRKNMINNLNIGNRPLFKKVKWAESLEIKETKNIRSFRNFLIYT
tara:strand:- start:186 stop:824 length:639 start_codon:yes stop_codon:yes gene_type:complete